MTWLTYVLLLVLLSLVVVAPLWPAWLEWRYPTDDKPLHIDQEDALDPPYLAKSFSHQLVSALANKSDRLGEYQLSMAPPQGPWPLSAIERRIGRSRLLWYAAVHLTLPEQLRLLAPAAARGNLCTASDGIYHSLWAGRHMRLSEGSTVQRWAHGRVVEVLAGCVLQGRVTADECIHVSGECTFKLLHAPVIEFGSPPKSPSLVNAVVPYRPGLPPQAKLDESTGRALCDESLRVEAYRSWAADLVCRGNLDLGQGCVVNGSIKAHGMLVLAAGCQVSGNLVAGRAIHLGAGSTVLGSVVSETLIVLSAGCVVGSPERPATVSAPLLEIAQGVTIHGTVWAGKIGGALQNGPMTREVATPVSASVTALLEAPSSGWRQAQTIALPSNSGSRA